MIWIILPAYNEGRGILRLLREIDETLTNASIHYRLIVIDDGSDDETSQQIQKFQMAATLTLITHRYNRGLGETIRDGIEMAVEQGRSGDVIVRMDADETHHPSHIITMLEEIAKGTDIVIASRFVQGGSESGVPLIRKLLSRGANLLMKLLFPLPRVTDYACGFRAYRYEVLQTALSIYGNDFIELKGLGFTGTVEKLIKLGRLGYQVKEIPLRLNYERKLSESKMSARVTALGYLVLAFKQIYPWGPREKRYRAAIHRFKQETRHDNCTR